MKTERVSFLNSRGIRLAARLDLPVRAMPKAFVVFAHCFTCSKEFKAAVNIGRALTKYGFGVLRFDFTGLGESEGEFAKTNFTTNIDDVIVAAQFLERDFQAPQILIGHSFGGIVMVRAARELRTVTAVVTIATPAEPRHVLAHFGASLEEIEREGGALVQVLGHRVWIEKQFVEDVTVQDYHGELRNLNKALLILHSPADDIVPIDHAARVFQTARHPKSFITLDSADHLLSERADASYVGTVIAAWVSRYLKPSVETKLAGDFGGKQSTIRPSRFSSIESHNNG